MRRVRCWDVGVRELVGTREVLPCGKVNNGQAALLGSSLQASGPYKEAEEMLLSSILGPSLSGI